MGKTQRKKNDKWIGKDRKKEIMEAESKKGGKNECMKEQKKERKENMN